MSTPSSLERQLRLEAGRRRRSAWLRELLIALPWCVVGGLLVQSANASADWIRMGFLGAAAGLGVIFAVRSVGLAQRLRREGTAPALRDWVERVGHADLLHSGAHLLLEGSPTRLSPLVLEQAESVAATLPPPPSVSLTGRLWAHWLLPTLLMAALLIQMGAHGLRPRGAGGLSDSDPNGGNPSGSGATRPALPEASTSRPKSDREAADVALTLRPSRRIYAFNAPIEIYIALESKTPLRDPIPLEVRLAVSDGLPYPDSGFGEGFRVFSLPLNWSVPKKPGRLEQRMPILDLLKSQGIYRPGLFTLEVGAAALAPGSPIGDGVMGNRVVIQVAENTESEQVKIRQPLEASDEKRSPSKDPAKNRKEADANPSARPPSLGEPDRLPEARRIPKAIEPLFNDGPMIEKEVSVWNREKGGDLPPPPPPPPETKETPAPPYTRQNESDVVRPGRQPRTREAIRRYFHALGGR